MMKNRRAILAKGVTGVTLMMTLNSLAQAVPPRTDWSGKGRDGGKMNNAANWSAGLPDGSTVCVVKNGSLKLAGDDQGAEPEVTGLSLTFDQVNNPATMDICAGKLTMMGTSGASSRWPNTGELKITQTGGEIKASDLGMCVKEGSKLSYVMSGGSLTVTSDLRMSGEGIAHFEQSGGTVDLPRVGWMGWNKTGFADYSLSGGTLKFEKLIIGNREGKGCMTVSGTKPLICGTRLELTADLGTLVFQLEKDGVATFGTAQEPLKQAILKGTLSLKLPVGQAPKSGETIKLVYARSLDSRAVVLDQKTAESWDAVEDSEDGTSVLCLKAK